MCVQWSERKSLAEQIEMNCHACVIGVGRPRLIPGGRESAFAFLGNRVREHTANRGEHGRRHNPLSWQIQLGDFAWELAAAVQPQAEFLEEVTGEVGIVGAFDTPESQAVFVLLQELERLLQFLHRGVKRGRQEVNG